MRLALSSALSVALWLLAAPALADDDEERDVWTARPTVLELHAGLGTPLGFVGLGLDHAPIPWLAICGGLGLGSGEGGGSVHVAVGTRARFLRNESEAWYFEIDYATGGWAQADSDSFDFVPSHGGDGSDGSDADVYADRIHWLHGSAGMETRFPSGWTFRGYVGLGTMLNPGSRRCSSGDACTLEEGFSFGGPTIFVMGAAFGKPF